MMLCAGNDIVYDAALACQSYPILTSPYLHGGLFYRDDGRDTVFLVDASNAFNSLNEVQVAFRLNMLRGSVLFQLHLSST